MISFSTLLYKFNHIFPFEIARNTSSTLKVLVPPGWKIERNGKFQPLEKISADNYDIVVSPVIFSGIQPVSLFKPNLHNLIKSFQPEVVDIDCCPGYLSAFQTIQNCKRLSPLSKIILRIKHQTRRTSFLLSQLVEKYNLKNANGLIADSCNTAKEIEKRNFKGKIKIIPLGVNTEVFRPRDLPELCCKINPRAKKVIAYFGPLNKTSELFLLFKAIHNLICRLLIIGDGGQRTQIINLARQLNLDFHIISSATHEEIAQYLNCIDIIYYPERTDNPKMGLDQYLPLEAMASGVAVVASDSESNRNLFSNAGLYYRYGNLEELRDVIQFFFDKPRQLNESKWNGRKRAVKYFSWKKIAKQTIEFYHEVLEEG